MNLTELRRLIKLVENSKLSEFELEEGDLRVRLVKSSLDNGTIQIVQPAGTAVPGLIVPQATIQPAMAEAPVPSAPPSNQIEVSSPMVGTFYRAPSPEAPPYVHVGDIVKPGQVMCIIEAMKLMNEIEAETAGKIVEIAIENAQPVEFGQLLFRIEPL